MEQSRENENDKRLFCQEDDKRDVFVDAGAPDGGDGSRESPYNTIQKAVDENEDEFSQVFVRPGEYREEVTVDRGPLWIFPAEQYGVVLRGSITIKKEKTRVRGLNIYAKKSGIILAEGAINCRIQQNRIHEVGRGCAGIKVNANTCKGCLISDNIIDLRDAPGHGRTGIQAKRGTVFASNRFEFNKVTGCETGIALLEEPRREEKTGTTEKSSIDKTSNVSSNQIFGNGTGLLIGFPSVSVRYNHFSRQETAAVSIEAKGAHLEGNRFFDDAQSVITSATEVTITSNIIAGAAGSAIEITGGDVELRHNTLHQGSDAAVLLDISENASCEATGNIFSHPNGSIRWKGGLSLSRNLFSTSSPFVETAVGASSKPNLEIGPEAIIGDPRFVDPDRDDFHLRPNSPAARAAGATKVRVDADGIGRLWKRAASIGAYEVEGGPEDSGTIHVVNPEATDGGDRGDTTYRTIADACAQAQPGDTVLLADGEYALEENIEGCAGAPRAPITIRPAKSGNALLKESKLFFDRCSYIRVQGLRFSEPKPGYLCLGPYCRNNSIVDTVAEGQDLGGSAMGVEGPGSQRNLFQGNVIKFEEGISGISIRCQQCNWHQTLRGNDISGFKYGIQTGLGSFPTAPPGYHVIAENVLHDNEKDGIHTKGTDQIIYGNNIYGNTKNGITTRYGARNVIVGNWIHGNGNGLRLHSPSHFVVNNVIFKNGGSGITAAACRDSTKQKVQLNWEPAYEPPHEIWIAHNTICKNGSKPISAGVGSRLMVLLNILVGSDPDSSAIGIEQGAALRQVEGNLYHRARPPLLREYEGGRYSIVADPMFKDFDGDDFELHEESPARKRPRFQDALSSVLSGVPCGIQRPDHIGSSLPPLAEATQSRCGQPSSARP